MSACNFPKLPKSVQSVMQSNENLPCSTLEIIELETQLNLSLPESYKDFLLHMGKGAGEFLQGEDCFYPDLLSIQSWARNLLAENSFPIVLPEDAFVFFMHQGYQFSFFKLSDGPNPPIYAYCEDQKEPDFVKTHDNFGEFLAVELNLYGQYSSPKSVVLV